MSTTAVVWNMEHKVVSWEALGELGADVALLNEATPPPEEVEALAHGHTEGRDEYPRPWSTAVVSSHPLRSIEDARAASCGRTRKVPFQNSRPGSWTAAVISTPELGDVTAISLYGLLDEMSDASVHRSLSEVSPIFDDDRYHARVLLGGDLNTSTGWDATTDARHLARDRAVLDRIAAYGLIDCLAKMRPPGRLEGCRCSYGDSCTHTWTRLDPRYPTIPYRWTTSSRHRRSRNAWFDARHSHPRSGARTAITARSSRRSPASYGGHRHRGQEVRAAPDTYRVIPRRPGKYLRERIRSFWSLFALVIAAATLLGLIVWLVLGHRTPLWLLLASARLCAVVMLWRNEEMRRWLRNHRQGADGEERVGCLLEEQLDDTHRALHDLEMRYGNLDHFVIGPTGAFAIETKAWTGRVWLGKGAKLMVGGRGEERAIAQAKSEAMWVHQLLSDAGIDVWVEAVVVLTHTGLPRGPIDCHPVRIVTLDELVPLIHAGRHPLSAHDVVRGANAILRTAAPVEVRSMMYEP